VNADVSQTELAVTNYENVRLLLSAITTWLEAPVQSSPNDNAEPTAWRSMWAAVVANLLEALQSGSLAQFEAGFLVVRDAVNTCDPIGRQAAMEALFGSLTRRAIAAGIDRTRFVEWFGPAEILSAPAGRMRGRVLYFDNAKGRGKVLGSDGVVYFVHFSMIQGPGFRSLDGGQLVEFTPQYGTFNGGPGVAASELARLTEGPDAEGRPSMAG